MKLIFLDMDGVMNDTKTMKEAKTCGRPRLDSMIGYEFVSRLNTLIEKSGAVVVLSSTWRLYIANLDQFREVMDRMGFTGEIVDCTPKFLSYRVRGHEIQSFLDDTELAVESFVILDDIDNMCNLSDRLVLTKEEEGMQDEHIDKALAILSTPLPSIRERMKKAQSSGLGMLNIPEGSELNATVKRFAEKE